MHDGIEKYGKCISRMTQNETVRLLGGSHHGKKLLIGQLYGPLVIRKKPKRITYTPGFDDSVYFDIEHEIYERKKMARCVGVEGPRVIMEVRMAFVKKGSKVKDETFWKMAMHVEKYMRLNVPY